MQKDSADPLDGWNFNEVEQYRQTRKALQLPKHDLYGHLYFFLLEILTALHERIRSSAVRFTLSGTGEEALPVHQLSNLLLWHCSAITGGVSINQTVLEGILSNEVSLLVDTKNMILGLDPLLQVSGGRHER